MDHITQILTYANQLAQLVPWDAAVYAPVVVVALFAIKKLKGIDNGEVMIWLLGAFSLLSGVADYLLHTPTSDPRIIAFKGFVTLVSTQPVYKLLFKPFCSFIANEVQKAATLNEIKTAAVPAGATVTGNSGIAFSATPLNPVTASNGKVVEVQEFNQ